jgi:hypothetical protein
MPLCKKCADSAENIILSYLIFDDVAINGVSLTDNVARFFCFDNTFVVGQVLTVSGCGAPFDGSRTVTEKNVDEYGVTYFEAAVTNADITKRRVIPNGRAVLTSQAALMMMPPEVREAALAVAATSGSLALAH